MHFLICNHIAYSLLGYPYPSWKMFLDILSLKPPKRNLWGVNPFQQKTQIIITPFAFFLLNRLE